MSSPEVLVVPTGTANVASVVAALARVGARPRLAESAREITRARHVVLPGVGAFAAAMEGLRADGRVAALRDRLERGAPTLAICLGMQLLCSSSEESPGVPGLGVLPDGCRRLRGAPRVPQLGWNRVEPDPGCDLLEPGFAYFAHGYRLGAAPAGWRAARATYGEEFVAALESGALLACQFHPELSGAWGQALLARWIERGRAA